MIKLMPSNILWVLILVSQACHNYVSNGQFALASLQAKPQPSSFMSTEGIKMHDNAHSPDDSSEKNKRRFDSMEPDEELLDLEDKLRYRNLLYEPSVQWLMEKAAFASANSRDWAIEKLRMILQSEEIEDQRSGDVYRPLGPRALLDCGDLHLCNQIDRVPWRIPADTLTRGLLIAGSQGAGKSRLLIYICRQLAARVPPINFFILDPKGGLSEWARFLNAVYIDAEDIRLDLSPPPGLTYEQFLPALMQQIADVAGLVYAVDLLQEASQICIGLRNKYIQKTGKNTEISLFDIYNAIPFVKDTSRGRRAGYRDALRTALGRILSGSGNLFKCREGASLATMFEHNIILGTRSITDHFAAKSLALFLLYWLYASERYSLPSDQAKRVLAFDDASRYLAIKPGFDATTTTSSFTNIFTRLRSSGNCVINTTQIPSFADPGVLALSHTILQVGPLHYGKDTRLLGDMMNLNEKQRQGLSRLDRREVIGRATGTAWPGIVHGRTVDVYK